MIKVRITVDVNPTEDERKVLKAVGNLFNIQLFSRKEKIPFHQGTRIILEGDQNVLNLFKIKIRHQGSQPILKMLLERNKVFNSTFLLINKQVAFVNRISFCENPSESPLGPIKLEIESENEEEIDHIISWLTAP